MIVFDNCKRRNVISKFGSSGINDFSRFNIDNIINTG